MVIKSYTVEEFDALAARADGDTVLEYIGGEIVEVPSNAYASKIAQTIAGEIYIFLKGKALGHLTGEDGGYQVSGERYAPDVAFISKARQPQLARQGYNPNPPDLAVEIDFPSDAKLQEMLRIKVVNYLAASTVVWVVLPDTKRVEVYVLGQPVKIVGMDGVLDGSDGGVLPGFLLPVKDIFPED